MRCRIYAAPKKYDELAPLYSITRSALGNKFAEDYSLPELGMKAALQRSKGGRTMVAVGTLIAERPPHGSRRALLTHRAPHSGQTFGEERV